jgi:hypothetical protein
MLCTAVRVIPLCPRGPRSGWGYVVPCPHRLIDPIRPSWGRTATSSQTYTRCPRCAGAPRRPPRGSVLSSRVLVRMSPSLTPGGPPAVIHPVPLPVTLAFAYSQEARHLRCSHNPLQVGNGFRGSISSLALQPADLLASLVDPTSPGRRADGDFYSRASSEHVAAEYDYRANWAICTGRTFTGWTFD